jgi:hypothetical protein
MHLRSIIVAGLVLAPVSAFGQEATPASPSASPPSASAAPATAAPSTDGYRVLAIAAGAVVGVVVVEFLSGGTLTPVLVAGGPAMLEPAAAAAPGAAAAVVEPVAAVPAGYGYSFLEVVKVAAGAIIGGHLGNMVYGK